MAAKAFYNLLMKDVEKLCLQEKLVSPVKCCFHQYCKREREKEREREVGV